MSKGTCHGALVPLFHPAAGACPPQAGRRAQRQINIVKLTHYPAGRESFANSPGQSSLWKWIEVFLVKGLPGVDRGY
jgi:hypothetical protein